MTKYIFSENEARKALEVLNEKMAVIFCQSVRRVRFVFLSHIPAKGIAVICGDEVLGQCVRRSQFEEVQIKVRRGWQNTAIHELAHIYNPDATEERIKVITSDVIKYLKRLT